MIIELHGLSIQIQKKAIKNMNIRIYPPDGAIKVSAPHYYSTWLIKLKLQQKYAWIHQQHELLKRQAATQIESIALETGALVSFMGIDYLMLIEEHDGPTQIKIQNNVLHFYIRPNTSSTQRYVLLDRWYRKELSLIVPELIKKWLTIIPVQVNEWGIKKMKTRWGSCNTRAQRIWLNLNLIKKPIVCLEYVLVHELTHLLEASHNKRFYQLMSQFMPQWLEYKQLLEQK
jgi:predicted metal-dependent hydrolase